MYIPAARESVRIEDRDGHFFVLCVDQERDLAYVIDLRTMTAPEYVRFTDILPPSQGLSLKQNFGSTPFNRGA